MSYSSDTFAIALGPRNCWKNALLRAIQGGKGLFRGETYLLPVRAEHALLNLVREGLSGPADSRKLNRATIVPKVDSVLGDSGRLSSPMNWAIHLRVPGGESMSCTARCNKGHERTLGRGWCLSLPRKKGPTGGKVKRLKTGFGVHHDSTVQHVPHNIFQRRTTSILGQSE